MQPHDSRRLEYGKERYHSFRRTIFDNPTQSDCRKAYDKNHKQCSSYNQATWNATGPLISSRQPKTAVASGSAFKTQSLDRIYTSLSPTIGYNVHSMSTIVIFAKVVRNCVIRIIAIFKFPEQNQAISHGAFSSAAIHMTLSDMLSLANSSNGACGARML